VARLRLVDCKHTNAPVTPITHLFDSIIKWIAGSTGAAVSFGLNVISLIFAVWGFWMYFAQKREYRLLFGMLQQFEVEKKLEAQKTQVEQEHQAAKERLKQASEDIKEAERELHDLIPLAAKRAYYEHTIPEVQKQVNDLEIQLQAMYKALAQCGGNSSLKSPELSKVLSEEVRRHVRIARDMERSRTLLSVYTAAVAATSILLPYPASFFAIPIGVLVGREAWRLYQLSKTYYGREKPKSA